MASSTLTTLSFLIQSDPPSCRIRNHSVNSTLKSSPASPIRLRNLSSLSSNSRNHSFLSPYHSHLRTLHKPTSNFTSPIRCSSPSDSPLEALSKFCREKAVVLLVGSFVFVGLLCIKSVASRPAKQSSYGGTMGMKRETYDGKSGDEEDMYLKLLRENPKDVEALKVVLYEKMRNGKPQEAVQFVERLIKVEPREVEWRLLQALCYEMMGHFSKAKTLFKEILAQRPLLLRALHGLAMVMHKNHEGPAVFEMLIKALEVASQEKRVTEERNIRILIGQMLIVTGELEEGLKHFQDLIRENPRDFRPYLCQGMIYSLLDKKKEAEEQFETYRSLVPEEFPQRGFIDDVVLAAKKDSKKNLEKQFKA